MLGVVIRAHDCCMALPDCTYCASDNTKRVLSRKFWLDNGCDHLLGRMDSKPLESVVLWCALSFVSAEYRCRGRVNPFREHLEQDGRFLSHF